MTYSVLWDDDASEDLGVVFDGADAALRDEIRSAVQRITQELTIDPFRSSESREEGERILISNPIGVRFGVDEANRQVTILSVWRIRRRDQ